MKVEMPIVLLFVYFPVNNGLWYFLIEHPRHRRVKKLWEKYIPGIIYNVVSLIARVD